MLALQQFKYECQLDGLFEVSVEFFSAGLHLFFVCFISVSLCLLDSVVAVFAMLRFHLRLVELQICGK